MGPEASVAADEWTGEVRYCQHCGSELGPDGDFCPECGAKPLTGESAVESAFETHRRYKLVGIAASLLSLLVLPIVLGPVAIGCGVQLYRKGEIGWGIGIAVAGVVGTLSGILLTLFYLLFAPESLTGL